MRAVQLNERAQAGTKRCALKKFKMTRKRTALALLRLLLKCNAIAAVRFRRRTAALILLNAGAIALLNLSALCAKNLHIGRKPSTPNGGGGLQEFLAASSRRRRAASLVDSRPFALDSNIGALHESQRARY